MKSWLLCDKIFDTQGVSNVLKATWKGGIFGKLFLLKTCWISNFHAVVFLLSLFFLFSKSLCSQSSVNNSKTFKTIPVKHFNIKIQTIL